eukprot:1286574-Rhodomonas_salina.1
MAEQSKPQGLEPFATTILLTTTRHSSVVKDSDIQPLNSSKVEEVSGTAEEVASGVCARQRGVEARGIDWLAVAEDGNE